MKRATFARATHSTQAPCNTALSGVHNASESLARFNLKDFTFKPLMTIPHIYFSSMSMWVDEAQNKIYVVYQDQLLRLPFSAGGREMIGSATALNCYHRQPM